MQTRPKFTGTAGGESCCGAVGGYVGKPTEPLRASHGARSRPLLPWELLGGPGMLGSTLALSSSCSNSLLTAPIEAAYTAERAVQSHRGPGAGADRRRPRRPLLPPHMQVRWWPSQSPPPCAPAQCSRVGPEQTAPLAPAHLASCISSRLVTSKCAFVIMVA